MTRIQLCAVSLLLVWGVAPRLLADDVTYETDANGVRYQVRRQIVQHQVNEIRYEPRETTVNRERYTTDMHDVQRTYVVPITEQQWVPGYQRTFNIFAPPVLTYRLIPVTRWETRTETVRIPQTRRELIPERQVQQVPVSTPRIVQNEYISKTYAGITPNAADGTAVARRIDSGGTSLSSPSQFDGQSDSLGGSNDADRRDRGR